MQHYDAQILARRCFKLCIGIVVLMTGFLASILLMEYGILPIPEALHPEFFTKLSASSLMIILLFAWQQSRLWQKVIHNERCEERLSILQSWCKGSLLLQVYFLIQAICESGVSGIGWNLIIALFPYGIMVPFFEINWRKYRKILDREAL